MNVFKITSAEKQEGWPPEIRTIYSSRRTPESVARHETIATEKKTRVCVEQLTGTGRGTCWCGTPCEYWPRR